MTSTTLSSKILELNDIENQIDIIKVKLFLLSLYQSKNIFSWYGKKNTYFGEEELYKSGEDLSIFDPLMSSNPQFEMAVFPDGNTQKRVVSLRLSFNVLIEYWLTKDLEFNRLCHKHDITFMKYSSPQQLEKEIDNLHALITSCGKQPLLL